VRLEPASARSHFAVIELVPGKFEESPIAARIDFEPSDISAVERLRPHLR
jgi:hypothetical protein